MTGKSALVPVTAVLAFAALASFASFGAVADEGARGDAGATPAAAAMRFSLELGAEHFRWQEFDDQGIRLLSEHGLRYAADAALHNFTRVDTGPLFMVTLRGYGGSVDYDGQDTSRRFVGTRTVYGGYGAEAAGGYRIVRASAPLSFDLTAGLGMDRWERSIRGGINAAGLAVAGFVEDYTITYARLGVALGHAGALHGRLNVGFRLPLRNVEDVVIGGEDIELRPGKQGTAYAAYRLSLLPHASGEPFGAYLRFSYDSYRFARSPSRVAGSLAVWQPESDMDVLGIALGFSY